MKNLFFALLFVPAVALAEDPPSVPYGTATTYDLELRDYTTPTDPAATVDFTAGDCATSACCKVIVDQDSTPDACDNQPVYIGNGIWRHTISIAESTGKTLTYAFTDAAASERFAYKAVRTYTRGNADTAFFNTTVSAVTTAVAEEIGAECTGGGGGCGPYKE